MNHQIIPLYEVERNDLVYAQESETDTRTSWTRVSRVDHEPGHTVVLLLADGSRIVGDSNDLVSVRVLRVVK